MQRVSAVDAAWSVAHAAASGALSRRSLLRGSAAGAAVASLGAAHRARAQGVGAPPALRDDLHALLNRTTQGFTADLWQEARARGFEGYLEWQLDHEGIDDSFVEQILSQLPALEMTPKQIYDSYGDTAFYALYELRLAAFVRSYLTRRQLHDRMVEFWTDHFNIYGAKDAMWYFQPLDQQNVIRRHALGKFPEMLAASAHSGAMLFYLDNYLSFANAINENYAREIMELHTLSVEGPYNEHDVKEVARCFTGWSLHFDLDHFWGTFQFHPQLHDQGQKTVLGHVIAPGGGVEDGKQVLQILATHPATARFLARKMAAWLLSEDPPQSVIDATASAYLATGGDIKAMIRVILSPSSFAQANVYGKPKFQRPWRFVMALLRATNPSVYDGFGLIDELDRMGHGPFYWPAPDGYPDKLSRWGSDVFGRWSFASRFFGNQMYGVTFSNQQILQIFAGAPKAKLAQRASDVLTGGTLPIDEVQRIQGYVDTFSLTNDLYRETLALTASSPSFQFC